MQYPFSLLSQKVLLEKMPFDTINARHLLSPLPAASHLYSLVSFLWLFDGVRLLKGIHRFETIKTAFIFLSPYFRLPLVTRGKRLCIFFPLEIVQISYRTWVWLPVALLSSAVLHYSSTQLFLLQ